MEIDPLIEELGRDSGSGTKELVESGAKILVAFAGGWPAADREEFLRGLVSVGRRMVAARPALAPLFHLVTELYARASEPADLAMVRRVIRTAAVEFTETFEARTAKVARQGASLLGGAGRILTLGRSQVVERALLQAVGEGSLAAVAVGEGRPGYDGRRLARRIVLAGGINVLVVTDASLGRLLSQVDLVLLGASAVTAEGIVTRTGASVLAAAARNAGKPAYVLGGVLTLLPPSSALPDPCVPRDPAEVWEDPPEGVAVENLPEEIVPAKLFKGIVMESGAVSPFEIEQRVRSMPVPPWLA